MKPTSSCTTLGQSLWLDNITRTMLDDGTLRRYIDELSVTGLTSNPTIFDKAISGGDAYDEQIAEAAPARARAEELFFELALADLRDAADLFAPVHERTDGVDGFVSLEVSPLLADDAAGDDRAGGASCTPRPSATTSSSRSPAPRPGATAIEESIFAGIPVNVTLLFSTEQYLAAAEAYMRGVERRIEAGLDPDVASVASLFISRWDVAVADEVARRAAQPARHRGRQAAPTAPTASCSTPTAGSASPTRAPGRSGCSGRAPGPRTPTPPTSSTSRRWRRRSPSTRCPRRRCSPSPTTARSASLLPPDGGDAERGAGRVRGGRDRRRRARRRLQEEGKRGASSSPGTTCSRRSRRQSRSPS